LDWVFLFIWVFFCALDYLDEGFLKDQDVLIIFARVFYQAVQPPRLFLKLFLCMSLDLNQNLRRSLKGAFNQRRRVNTDNLMDTVHIESVELVSSFIDVLVRVPRNHVTVVLEEVEERFY